MASPATGGALVLGLGRFGTAVGRELQALGVDVTGVDVDPAAVRGAMEDLARVVEADAANIDALREIGGADMPLAIVAIGSSLEASVLATHALLELGVPTVVAKAMTESHAQILERIGAHRVVFVERDMGVRVAHLVVGRAIEYLPLDEDFVLIETPVPASLVGQTLAEAQVRTRHGVSVVCIKPGAGRFTHAMPETVLAAGDIIVVAGPPARAEAFAALR